MFDELKKIAGVHTGATPLKAGTADLRKLKTPIAPMHAAPAVVSHPLAPVIRTTAVNPIAPVQRTPAPAPAPMPKHGSVTPPAMHFTQPMTHVDVPKASPAMRFETEATPPRATSPALANLAAAAGVSIPSPSPSGGAFSRTDRAAPSGGSSIPSASPSGGTFYRTDHTASEQRAESSQSFAGADNARGFERVERSARPKNAQGMPPSGSNETRGGTLKGRTTMGYKGTGEITYCPINSNGLVAASAQATLPGVRPSKPFQGQHLLIDAVTGAAFAIVDIKLGNEPVAVTAGSVDGGCFPAQNGPKFEWKVADGVDIIFTVQNKLTASTAFTAMLVGEVCVQS